MYLRSCLSALLFFLLAPASLRAAHPAEYYVEIPISDRAELETLTELSSISDVHGMKVHAYATDAMLEQLRKAGYRWTVLPHPGDTARPRMARSMNEARAFAAYPSFGQYEEMMIGYADDHPSLTRLTNIGDSQNGHALWCLRITDNPGVEEDEPEVLYASTMHGDEPSGYIMMLRLIDELLEKYGQDPDITTLVDNVDLWICPLSNPDGAYAVSDDSVEGGRRFLANGVDANRNFPDPDRAHPDGNDWAPETVATMDFFAAHHFTLSANFHAGAEVVNYPWDTMPDIHADENWFLALSHAYADQARSDGPRGYMHGFDEGVTNGWDWYPAHGTRQDYITYFLDSREVTIELTLTSYPSPVGLEGLWKANRQALLEYPLQALEGLRGIVSDSQGNPLEATLSIPDHDYDHSEVTTDAEVGDYHRMLEPGTYTVEFSAPGFKTQIIPSVVIREGAITRLDVVMDVN